MLASFFCCRECQVLNVEVEIYQLSEQFLRDYPAEQYPELMCKRGRPYSCLLIDLHFDYYICIPYRSSIRHKNAYLFTGTQRSLRTKSGLDYSKIVLIQKKIYLNDKNVVVDQDEYTETIRNIKRIAGEAVEYIEGYIHHVDGTKLLHPRAYDRKYKFSTLPYFHDILGL